MWRNKDKCVECKYTNAVVQTVQSGRIGADEAIDDTDGKGAEELEERLKEKEAKTQAILLEMVRAENLLWTFCGKCSLKHFCVILSYIPLGGWPAWCRS